MESSHGFTRVWSSKPSYTDCLMAVALIQEIHLRAGKAMPTRVGAGRNLAEGAAVEPFDGGQLIQPAVVFGAARRDAFKTNAQGTTGIGIGRGGKHGARVAPCLYNGIELRVLSGAGRGL